MGGYNSRQALQWMDTLDLPKDTSKLLLVTLSFGSNDCSTDPAFHVGLEEYRNNMRKMILKILNIGRREDPERDELRRENWWLYFHHQ
eukprot:gnl/Chilomastix_caulleri/2743.p2 GENE.gnl/Chilomastix_caulleri/2743~~gnl/Chilomastix_caulleri/2743.p2  ORF type:complete len:88 (-),score=17.06 gnl/Chilomastix_caulleri/2743:363-626(-)